MLHKISGKVAGQARQVSFAREDFHKTICHRQTKWCRRALPGRLASGHCSSNSKPDQSGPCSIQLIPRAVLIWQACYRPQACQTDTHLALGCIDRSGRSGAAKPLQGQLTSRRPIAFAGLPTIFIGKTDLPNLARHFSGSFVQHGVV